jgi:GntR family transcriptional regulator
MLSIDHKSALPLRAQVEALLRDLVRQANYQKGDLLPDEITLAAQLGVSRGTVRSGISKLVFEGILERKAGVGTRVSNQQLESGIKEWRSFTREMASKGITVQNFSIRYQQAKATEAAAQALQLDEGTPILRLERVRGWDDQPVLHSTSWFHPRLKLSGDEQINLPLYEMLEKQAGVRPHHAREEFLAVCAETRIARLLRVNRGTPLLLRRHTVYDPGNRPFEFAEVCYVSSRFTLSLDMRRSEP